MHPFLYAFGLFQHNIDQIKEMEEDIAKFKRCQGEAVFVFFVGAVNHLITFIVHKESSGNIKYYLLDSSNLQYLDKT